MKILSPEYLAECFSYDPETGLIHRKARPAHHFTSAKNQRISNARSAGKVVQAKRDNKYVSLHVAVHGETIPLLAHRVAFCLQVGRWPEMIDHIDGDRANNKWSNLREATAQQNAQNVKARKHNRSGVKWAKRRADGRYESRATVNGKSNYFGAFDTAQEASICAARHLADLHGEFLNTGRGVE